MKKRLSTILLKFEVLRGVALLLGLMGVVFWSVQAFLHPDIIHPIKTIFAFIFGKFYKFLNGGVLPITFKESHEMPFSESLSLFAELAFVIYSSMLICRYLVDKFIGCLTEISISKELGESGVRHFNRFLLKQAEAEDECEELMHASKKHFKEWTRFYKSDLSYE
ncbi:TPA: hypothetical protein ACUA4C_004848, partial [Escherichia coli]